MKRQQQTGRTTKKKIRILRWDIKQDIEIDTGREIEIVRGYMRDRESLKENNTGREGSLSATDMRMTRI